MAITNAQTPHTRKLRRDGANRRLARIIAAGGRKIGIVLLPEAAAALETLTADGSSVTSVISRLLIEAAEKKS